MNADVPPCLYVAAVDTFDVDTLSTILTSIVLFVVSTAVITPLKNPDADDVVPEPTSSLPSTACVTPKPTIPAVTPEPTDNLWSAKASITHTFKSFKHLPGYFAA